MVIVHELLGVPGEPASQQLACLNGSRGQLRAALEIENTANDLKITSRSRPDFSSLTVCLSLLDTHTH